MTKHTHFGCCCCHPKLSRRTFVSMAGASAFAVQTGMLNMASTLLGAPPKEERKAVVRVVFFRPKDQAKYWMSWPGNDYNADKQRAEFTRLLTEIAEDQGVQLDVDPAPLTDSLTRIMFKERVRPRHLIVDQGMQFKCEHFEDIWCNAMGIRPRFGAVARHGSISVVERFHRTFKELLEQILISEEPAEFKRQARSIVDRYNQERPHVTLGGRTPNEVYFSRPPANQRPRLESRQRWPRGSPCARPQVDVEGKPGDPLVFQMDCLEGRRHLPIIRTRRAA